MWVSLGVGRIVDVLTSGWWALLVVALAAFPDGRFTPRWLRWLPVLDVEGAALEKASLTAGDKEPVAVS
jgi:hypothetical protein